MTNDSLLKFTRAGYHLDRFITEMENWFGGEHHTVTTEPEPEKEGYFTTYVEAEDLPADPFSLIIGDFLQAARSGLDHLAYALATHNAFPLPHAIASTSEFPIIGNVSRRGKPANGADIFRDSKAQKIGGMSAEAQAVIEDLQPYQRGDDYTEDGLWILHELCCIDKHRLVHVVASAFQGALLRVDGWKNAALGPGQMEVFEGAIEGRTKVVTFPISPVDPTQKMHVDFQPALGIAFDETVPLVGGERVVGVLLGLREYISGEVVPRLLPFLT